MLKVPRLEHVRALLLALTDSVPVVDVNSAPPFPKILPVLVVVPANAAFPVLALSVTWFVLTVRFPVTPRVPATVALPAVVTSPVLAVTENFSTGVASVVVMDRSPRDVTAPVRSDVPSTVMVP